MVWGRWHVRSLGRSGVPANQTLWFARTFVVRAITIVEITIVEAAHSVIPATVCLTLGVASGRLSQSVHPRLAQHLPSWAAATASCVSRDWAAITVAVPRRGRRIRRRCMGSKESKPLASGASSGLLFLATCAEEAAEVTAVALAVVVDTPVQQSRLLSRQPCVAVDTSPQQSRLLRSQP